MTRPLREALRAARGAQARAVGALLAAAPALEPAFIRAGRSTLSRSRIGRGLYWYAHDDLVRRLRRSGNRFRRLRIAGHDVFVDVTDGTGRLHYFHGEPYEPELVAALPGLLPPGSVFVDVGANIGFFSVLAARIVGPAGRVIAFEPHPGARETFRAAAAVNGLSDRIEIVDAALGGAGPPTARLFVTGDSVLSSTEPERAPLRQDYPFTGAIEVRRLTLDGWMASQRGLAPRIAAIKIDVEGGEMGVLEGMAGTLADCPRAAIVCETDAGSEADRWLRGRGYACSLLEIRQHAFGNYLYVR